MSLPIGARVREQGITVDCGSADDPEERADLARLGITLDSEAERVVREAVGRERKRRRKRRERDE